jgi:hypothetical protein
MKKTYRWTIALVFTLAALASVLFVPSASSQFPTTCASWLNSSVHYETNYGGYCGGYGGACAECSTGWSTGYSVCVSDSYGNSMCTDYQY